MRVIYLSNQKQMQLKYQIFLKLFVLNSIFSCLISFPG